MRRASIALSVFSLAAACEGDLFRHGSALDEGEHHHHVEPPPEYRDLENPLAGEAQSAMAGARLFAMHCASCHGAAGRGDGPMAGELDPPPADFQQHGQPTDGYLFWRIREGGEAVPFESSMPAWKDDLTEEQTWQIVTHLRTIIPEAAEPDGDHDGGHADEPEGDHDGGHAEVPEPGHDAGPTEVPDHGHGGA